MKLKGTDAKEFWENEKNPRVTKEQIELFKDARRIEKENITTIDLNDRAIDEVAEKIAQKVDIPIEKANVILRMGIVEGFMLNKFRRIFKDSEEE